MSEGRSARSLGYPLTAFGLWGSTRVDRTAFGLWHERA
jgi:hypothetical protein